MFRKLLVLIITAFVDMVGLLMVLPLMPFYARDLGAGSMVVVIMVVSFTAAQLLSAPLWGRFSDRYGRRPALLVGLGAAAIAYVVFAFASSIWLLLAVASRTRRRWRYSRRDSSVCRRLYRATVSRQGARVAERGNKSWCCTRAAARISRASCRKKWAGPGCSSAVRHQHGVRVEVPERVP